MKQLTVRNVTHDLAHMLAEESHRRGQSTNKTVIDILRQALGLSPNSRYNNNLGELAGTWSAEDLAEFEKNTALFEQIDEELWS